MGNSGPYHLVDDNGSDTHEEPVDIGTWLSPKWTYHHPQRHNILMFWIKWLAMTVFLAIYTAAVARITWRNVAQSCEDRRRYGTRILPSLAEEYIVYEPHVMEQWEDETTKKYFGEPNEQLDKNWHDLFEHQNLGIPAHLIHELKRENEAILFPDGTYYGTIMVFHHLHCLKNIQHALHPEYYALDKLQEHESAMHWEHTDHCLHMLMDAIRCQGDTTLITMLWEDSSIRPIGNLTSPHECINWDRLMEWVTPNSRDLFVDGALVHPTLGPLMSGGRPTRAFIENMKDNGVGRAGLV